MKQEKGKLLYHLLSDVKSSLNKYEDAENSDKYSFLPYFK